LNEQIARVQAKHDIALELVGVKMVRSAPSSRVGARSAVDVGIRVSEKELGGNNALGPSEQSEIEKLK
jgi:RNase P/RNase MRP subunit p30